MEMNDESILVIFIPTNRLTDYGMSRKYSFFPVDTVDTYSFINPYGTFHFNIFTNISTGSSEGDVCEC